MIIVNGKYPNKKQENIKYCIECGSEIGDFLLPLYNYENKFCEKCEIDDYEGNLLL